MPRDPTYNPQDGERVTVADVERTSLVEVTLTLADGRRVRCPYEFVARLVGIAVGAEYTLRGRDVVMRDNGCNRSYLCSLVFPST